jgi:electron transfer flavoprotein alpha/beta subunit
MGMTRKQMTNVAVVDVVDAPTGHLLKFRADPGSGRCLEHCLPIVLSTQLPINAPSYGPLVLETQ